MRYPCDYGYVPHTLSEDGDPVDVMVISPYPLIHGVVIRVRPIGMLRMTDESGKDAKILAVPVNDLSPAYAHMESPKDLPPLLLQQITHFFEHYKDLEPNKWVKIDGWEDADAAKREILTAQKRYNSEKPQ
jgi:inorganic pyrophosphatase